MVTYQETRVTLTKSAAKDKAEIILKLNKKSFEDGELPHKLFLTRRKTTKIRNNFARIISTDIELSKAQIPEITQSGGSFGFWFSSLGKKALTSIVIKEI